MTPTNESEMVVAAFLPVRASEYAALRACAEEVEKQVEQKFKRRGWTTGKKMWEKQLLHLAKLALGKPSPFNGAR